MSFGKSSSKSTQQQQSSQTGTGAQSGVQAQTETPNNLPHLQMGWNLADALTSGTAGNALTDANNGLSLTNTGAQAASGAAVNGLQTAGNFANGGTANPGNEYYKPFADGSMTGNNNPYFAGLLKQVADGAQSATDGAFGASSRYGSGANAHAFNDTVANAGAQMGYQNFNDSLNRQLQGATGISTNNTNSVNQAMAALGLIPALGTAATGAGQSLYQTGTAPLMTDANSLALFGQGGGTAVGSASGTTSNSASGTASGTGTQSGTSFGLDLGKLIQPFKLFG